jgi:hypothetical protein
MKTSLLKVSLQVLLLLNFFACAEKDNESDGTGGPTVDSTIEIEARTDTQGRATISFVTGEVNKLAITANTDENTTIRFTRVQEGSNNYLSPGGQSISLANEFFRSGNTVSVPSRMVDPVLQPRVRFEVGVEVRNAGGNERPVTFNITSRNDNNLRSGTLQLNIFHVGAVAAEESSRTAVTQALSEARNILSSAAGINVQVQEFDIAGPVTLPSPSQGDRLYLDASRNAPSPSVNVFIGGDIGGGSSGTILGIAAGIPGPPMPSRKSGVAVSLFAAAGSNGRFDSEDIRLLGETIAHESAHQMGLFHPVDFSGSVVIATDPIDDTEECSFFTECVNRESLVRNLMFPNPVSDSSGSLIPQNQLSEGQRGVLNRYVAVD